MVVYTIFRFYVMYLTIVPTRKMFKYEPHDCMPKSENISVHVPNNCVPKKELCSYVPNSCFPNINKDFLCTQPLCFQ